MIRKTLLLIAIISMSSCILPYSTYDYTEPTRTYYPTYYQPTRVVIIKKNKPQYKKKRHIKVKINKHRKRK